MCFCVNESFFKGNYKWQQPYDLAPPEQILLHVGHVKRNGKIAVIQFDSDTNIGSEAELSSLSQVNDHNNPALHVRPDGKILASYSRHNPDSFFSCRISVNTSPSTIEDWGAESTHGLYKYSYSNTYAMSGESDKIYSFTRAGAGWNLNWTTSADSGVTWSHGYPKFS